MPFNVMLDLEFSVDRRVLFFTAAVSTTAGILFGLFPALGASRVDIVSNLNDDRGMGRAGFRLLLFSAVCRQTDRQSQARANSHACDQEVPPTDADRLLLTHAIFLINTPPDPPASTQRAHHLSVLVLRARRCRSARLEGFIEWSGSL